MTRGTTIACHPCSVTQLLDVREAVAMAEVAMFIAAHSDCAEFDICIEVPRSGADPVRVSLQGD